MILETQTDGAILYGLFLINVDEFIRETEDFRGVSSDQLNCLLIKINACRLLFSCLSAVCYRSFRHKRSRKYLLMLRAEFDKNLIESFVIRVAKIWHPFLMFHSLFFFCHPALFLLFLLMVEKKCCRKESVRHRHAIDLGLDFVSLPKDRDGTWSRKHK